MNIYVGNLSYTVTEQTLQTLFTDYGHVTSVSLIKDPQTGRSKGFGFVEMPNDEEAMHAIAGLNETELDGRAIVVKQANPRPDRPEGTPPSGDDSSGS